MTTMAADEKIYLLDTRIALWIMCGDSKLEETKFRERYAKPSHFIFHQISTWEIQIKYSMGKLLLPQRPETFLLDAVHASGFEYRAIEDDAIFFLGKLPPLHRDPFDRLLIAHASINGWTLLTRDKAIDDYPIKVELI